MSRGHRTSPDEWYFHTTFDDIEMWDWMFAHYVLHLRALLPERRDKFFTTVV
ncbi:MAG: hypothetical protein QGG09_22245 [Pirellulaceae bacterium]|nr:hypothetical protein [Pirellulaceae bacterium]